MAKLGTWENPFLRDRDQFHGAIWKKELRKDGWHKSSDGRMFHCENQNLHNSTGPAIIWTKSKYHFWYYKGTFLEGSILKEAGIIRSSIYADPEKVLAAYLMSL